MPDKPTGYFVEDYTRSGEPPVRALRFPVWRERAWARVAGAAGLALAAFAARTLLTSSVPTGYAFITFYPAVIVAAYVFGGGPALLTALLGAGFGWLFFIAPGANFVMGTQPGIAVGTYLLLSGLVIAVTNTLQSANLRLVDERERSRKLAENRAVLFGELQHRVGNNLQMISSVLMLQRKALREPEALAAIDDAARRVGLIGRVQRRLYEPDGAQLDLGEFLRELCRDLILAAGAEHIAWSVAAAPGLALPPRLAIPTALIVAEALNNALEHGLAGRDSGRLELTAAREGDRLVIEISDDGAGLAPDFAIERDEGLGLRISRKLAQYHGGTLAVVSANGTTTSRFEVALS